MIKVTDQWVQKEQAAAEGRRIEEPPTAQYLRDQALERLQEAAKRHATAIEAGVQALPNADGMTPEHLVTAILTAGNTLDGCIAKALDLGISPADIARVAYLHPSYVAELQRNPF